MAYRYQVAHLRGKEGLQTPGRTLKQRQSPVKTIKSNITEMLLQWVGPSGVRKMDATENCYVNTQNTLLRTSGFNFSHSHVWSAKNQPQTIPQSMCSSEPHSSLSRDAEYHVKGPQAMVRKQTPGFCFVPIHIIFGTFNFLKSRI